MADELSFRDALRHEVPMLVAMLADDELGAGREHPDSSMEPYFDAFDALDSNNRVLVAESDGLVVGTLQLTFIAGLSRGGVKRAQIEAVRVHGSSRGRGIGEAMVAEAIEIARRQGCGLVQLTTDKKRTDAHRFYERLGFVATHEGMKLALD